MLLTILTIIWFCLLLIIPGGFTLLAALKRGRITYIRGWSEFLFLSFLGSFSLISLIGLISAQLGVFSLPLVAGGLLLYSLLILTFFRPDLDQIGAILSRQRPVACGWRGQMPPLILLSIMILAGILFLRPTEYIFGGWDPGVYAEEGLDAISSILRNVDYFILNHLEFENLLGTSEAEEIGSILGSLKRGIKVMIKRGSEGCALSECATGTTIHVDAVPLEELGLEVVNTVGCGDAFIGAFAAAKVEGLNDMSALRRGCAAGSFKATRKETRGGPTAAELKSLLDEWSGSRT